VGVKGSAPSVVRDTPAQNQAPSASLPEPEPGSSAREASPPEPRGAPLAPATETSPLAESLPPTNEIRLARNFEAVGQLAAGVAHEINTPMQYIGDNVAFLGTTIRRLLELATSFEGLVALHRSGQPVPEQAISACERELNRQRLGFLREQAPLALEQTLGGVDQVRSIVQALKEFSHPGEENAVDVDIHHLVDMASTVTRSTWRYVANLRLELCDTQPMVRGYPQELGQVLINLIVNAAHAVEERYAGASETTLGTITIRTRSASDHVEIQIADDGRGIPEAIRDRIMAPYFTTKPAGKGTGQGLPLARRVITERHRGRLYFESHVGVGTTFFVVLPGAPDAG
jgi:signal transduction histidine kinase